MSAIPAPALAASGNRAAPRTGKPGASRGQASVEFVALLPLIVLMTAVAVQALLFAFTYWNVSVAARVGARTAHVEGEYRQRALAALPGVLAGSARVGKSSAGATARVRVSARPPALFPAWLMPRVHASTGFGAGRGTGNG